MAVGDDGQYVFVMLPGYHEKRTRSVDVPCESYESSGDRKQVWVDLSKACAEHEELTSAGRRGEVCQADCSRPHWSVSTSDKNYLEYEASGLYRIGDRKTPLWTVEWYAFRVYLSADGRYLARMGPWASYEKDLAVAFYDRGVLTKEYMVKDLVADPASLPHSVSHFMWRREVKFDTQKNQLLVATLNDEAYVFDIKSGKTTVAIGLPEPAHVATVTNRRGEISRLSNVKVCGGRWLALVTRFMSGRSASYAFHGFVVKESTSSGQGTTTRLIEAVAIPFSNIETIHHIGQDSDGENDIWLVKPRSGQSISLSTEKNAFAICGDADSSASETFAAKELKAIVFE